MSRRGNPGGSRAPNDSGCIQAKPLASGELRYHARLHNKWLGSFETRREAQRAVDDEKAKLGLQKEISP